MIIYKRDLSEIFFYILHISHIMQKLIITDFAIVIGTVYMKLAGFFIKKNFRLYDNVIIFDKCNLFFMRMCDFL